MNSVRSFHLQRGAIHELAYWERPCIKLMKCEARLIYHLLHVHLKWKINPNKTLTQRKNENKWRCILKGGSTSETWDLRHVRVCLCACINAPKVIQCSLYGSGLSVHPFPCTCRTCGCYEAYFFFGFLNKTETFILLHYQHSAKILYLAHQQLLNKFLSLFAWIFSQELLEIKLFFPAVLELVKKILSSLQFHCSLNISKNTNYTDKYRSALGGNKMISMLPWKRHKHTFLWLQKAGIIIGIDRFQNMLKKYSYLLSMHWVRSTALRQHFLCMGNSQEAVFIVDAWRSKQRKLFRLSWDQMTTSRSSVENKFGLRAATATSGLGKQTNKKWRTRNRHYFWYFLTCWCGPVKKL